MAVPNLEVVSAANGPRNRTYRTTVLPSMVTTTTLLGQMKSPLASKRARAMAAAHAEMKRPLQDVGVSAETISRHENGVRTRLTWNTTEGVNEKIPSQLKRKTAAMATDGGMVITHHIVAKGSADVATRAHLVRISSPTWSMAFVGDSRQLALGSKRARAFVAIANERTKDARKEDNGTMNMILDALTLQT